MDRLTRVLSVALLAVFVGLFLGVAPRAAGQPIGPHQHYKGRVNGKHAGAVIYVVCPGPADGNRTGPPAANQSVEVVRARFGGGYTGPIAREVWAQFGRDELHVVGFERYNVAKLIPITLRLPCEGEGTVMFTTCFGTIPCAEGAKDDVVTVRFENLAV